MRVGMIVVPGFDVMSFAPLSVFDAANIMLGEQRYEVQSLVGDGWAFATHSEWKLSQNRSAANNLTR